MFVFLDSLDRHRLEVEADISTSETASAQTYESEKSAANAIETASTKALAGSILNYRQVGFKHINILNRYLILKM